MKALSALLATTALSAALALPALAAADVETAQTEAPNAPDQQPAFEEQFRAPLPPELATVEPEVFAEGLPGLWAMQFLPDGRVLVTAKEGALHIISTEGEAGPAIEGVPEVDARGQGGLLDVVLAPDFEQSNRIFFSFSEPREGGNATSVASATLVADDAGGGALENVEVIFQQTPVYDGEQHFGSRLVFGPEGELYVTVGERSDPEPRVQAQDLSSGLGKVFRITETGEAFEGNPFVDEADALPEIWSYGHRNVQSAALDPQDRLWIVEHGPRGGDELNRPEAGLNYGWPDVTYGIDYSGAPIGEGITARDDVEQPVYYWDPSIGPSGMAWYEGDEFPTWDGVFLIGGLAEQALSVVHMGDDDLVEYEEIIDLGARIRDVRVNADGDVYVLTEGEGGSEIWRLTNAG